MPDNFTTLADIQLINGDNLEDLDVTDLIQGSPFLASLYAKPASNGDLHKYNKEIKAPVVGFRNENDGRAWDKSGKERVTITLKIMDATFGVDIMVAKTHKDGVAGYLAEEGDSALRAAFFGIEQQLIYGEDAKGFIGLNGASTLAALDERMVVNGGGTDDGEVSSVFLIRTGKDDCSVVAGRDANIEIGDSYPQALEGANGKYNGLVTPIEGRYGLQIGSAYSVGLIGNLTAANGLTDDLLFELYSKFPAGKKPNLAVMGSRSLEQLRKSRTATNPSGTPAPIPETVINSTVKVVETSAIKEDESLVPATAP